jgi:hypothetical protein
MAKIVFYPAIGYKTLKKMCLQILKETFTYYELF